MTDPFLFTPIDPAKFPVAYLKRRTGLLFAAMERGEIPEMPLAPGWFRCFVCRREFEKGVPDEAAGTEYRRRFGEDADPEGPDAFIVCDDCNRIVSEDQGVPL